MSFVIEGVSSQRAGVIMNLRRWEVEPLQRWPLLIGSIPVARLIKAIGTFNHLVD